MVGNGADREVTVTRLPDDSVTVRVAGRWRLQQGGLASVEPVERALAGPPVASGLRFDARDLGSWDTSLVLLIERVLDRSRARGVEVDRSGLPEGLQRLMALGEAGPGTARLPPASQPPSLLERVGNAALDGAAATVALLAFVGELTIAFGRLLARRARFRAVDLIGELQAAGAGALPIVSIVSLLLGMILAFVGDVTLRPFGASLYVANVVTVAMVRELGPAMTAIVMAGRTGSAYAAQLGTMRVTQEIDALVTMGLPPMEFLVLPRMIALTLMIPLLCCYADAVALLGGSLVSAATGVAPVEYLRQVRKAIPLGTVWLGLGKSLLFGALVAIAGCREGLGAGRSAAAVGRAATAAVVTSIVWIIAADGVLAVVCHLVGI